MSKTLLLVEDDEVLLKMYAQKFSEDFVVKTADDGKKALAMVKDPLGQPDVVLLDVMIPELDGFEVLRRMKADPETNKIPVILLTDFGVTESDRERGMDLGADSYLLKSEVTPAEIIKKVNATIKE